MNKEIQQIDTEFGLLPKENGNIANKNSLKKMQLYLYDCFKMFDEYDGLDIGMGRFVKGLYDNNWNVVRVEINPKDNIYQLYSKKYNVILNIKLSTELNFQQINQSDYQVALNLLNSMSKGAEIKNNKVIPLFKDENIKNNMGYKNLKVYPKTKKLLSKKTKIVLLTLTAAAIAIFAGKVISDSINSSNDKQVNNSYTYQQSPVSGVSQEIYDRSIYLAQQDAIIANNDQQSYSYQSYSESDFSNQNTNYYHEGQEYYQSPIPNVSDDVYNRSVKQAQQQSYRR